MKKQTTLIIVIALLAFTLPALGADAAGNWRGTVSTSKGEFPIAFSFKVAGSSLEGTMLGTDRTPFKIEAGKVDGNNLSFSVTLNYPGKSLQRTYKGIINGDEIRFTVDSSDGSTFVVKREK